MTTEGGSILEVSQQALVIPRTWFDNFDIKVVASLNESASGMVLRLQNQQYILDCAKRSFKPRIMGH